VSAIAADIEDCEIAKSAAEKDRDLTRRRKERTDRDLLDAERALAATREEHLRAQAKADRLTELRRELVRLRCSIAQLTSPNHRQITNQTSASQAEIETEEKEGAADEARLAAERAPAEAERDRLAAIRDDLRAKARAAEAEADDATRTLQREVKFGVFICVFLPAFSDCSPVLTLRVAG